MFELAEGAYRVLTVCAGLRPHERLLIVSDPGRPAETYEALAAEGRKLGSHVDVALVPVGGPPGGEPPEDVAKMMLSSDVIIAATTRTLFHTNATVAAAKAGARILTLTHCEVGTLTRGGIEADFEALEPIALSLANRLTAASRWHITAPGGTDVSGGLAGREGWANTSLCHRRGKVMGVPDVEAFVAPVDDETNGTIVIDASTSVMGLIDEPIRLIVEKGRVVDFAGGHHAEELRELVDKYGLSARVIAEIGIGLNPKAQVTGAIIEDEAAYGTGHFALGRNTTFGGLNDSPVHIDMVYWKPTIVLDGKPVMRDGALVEGSPVR